MQPFIFMAPMAILLIQHLLYVYNIICETAMWTVLDTVERAAGAFYVVFKTLEYRIELPLLVN